MKKCFKEWNAVVEALGKGKQSILIRKYRTNVDKFLLYPTVSYTVKDDYLTFFKEKYADFVGKNSLPDTKEGNVEIKYYASVEKIVEASTKKISSFDRLHIWNKNHIKSYMGDKKGYIWVLRIYKLPEPIMASAKKAAITFAELDTDISLENSAPVLSDKEFENIISKF